MDPADPTAPATVSPPETKNALYARCASFPSETIFSQDDLLELDIIPNKNLDLLLQCTKKLTQEGLFKLLSHENRAVWRVVKKEDAQKYRTLSADEALVYSLIESAGREGVWSRILRSKSGLHMTVMTRCLKTLEGKSYIKQIKTVKFPNRKTYMLAGLQPSEDVTGGPFYTDGVLDDEFVHQMAKWTERFIVGRSWYQRSPSDPHHQPRTTKLSSIHHKPVAKQQLESKRNAALETPSRHGGSRAQQKELLPFPPGYTGYPTIAEITKAINTSGLSPVVMKEVEMKQLLDILIWDGRVEENSFTGGYKAVRLAALAVLHGSKRAEDDGAGSAADAAINGWSALTEAPCGRCPVLAFCEEGGPVNARTCEYFAEWLEV
ncbi:MAG: hypothetical protein LQ348_002353 [Seirophora lacunosa]|nr:MAG: hypothetical protein LQ344_003355 [Seirophora lacunosa]KAI4196145.1 MAG: hypothetical protein LQ348_002353 [Seirophora lacunosa]